MKGVGVGRFGNVINGRGVGAFMHPSSFPGDQGIGVLDRAVDDWLDFLAHSGIRYWQTCPLGPTGYADSPYQCFSTFAGNPYLIDLADLVNAGLLPAAALEPLRDLPAGRTDYAAISRIKLPLLLAAYREWRSDHVAPSYDRFEAENQNWLPAYAFFMALRDTYGLTPWWEWPAEFKFFSRAQEQRLPGAVQELVGFHRFLQYVFFEQWGLVKQKANAKGIQIIGDAPIYVSGNSADVWAHPELFEIDQSTGRLHNVAGVPPDYFSHDGQLWGNPLYDWGAHARDGYAWWVERLRFSFKTCDILRIDHFRAFDSYWSVPGGSHTARHGHWRSGPGHAFFDAVSRALPDAKLIAEDLGELFPTVTQLKDSVGLPGMAVLHFAFGDDDANPYLPHNLHPNTVLYPGTHDNDTTLGWYHSAPEHVKHNVRSYLGVSGDDIAWDMIKLCYRSRANLCVIPLQDFMNLGGHARFNTPGVALGNWAWRYTDAQLQALQGSADYLQGLGRETGRV